MNSSGMGWCGHAEQKHFSKADEDLKKTPEIQTGSHSPFPFAEVDVYAKKCLAVMQLLLKYTLDTHENYSMKKISGSPCLSLTTLPNLIKTFGTNSCLWRPLNPILKWCRISLYSSLSLILIEGKAQTGLHRWINHLWTPPSPSQVREFINSIAFRMQIHVQAWNHLSGTWCFSLVKTEDGLSPLALIWTS